MFSKIRILKLLNFYIDNVAKINALSKISKKYFNFMLVIYVFLVITGMKLILKDGNFIEVNRFSVGQEKVFFEKNGKKYVLPVKIIDMNSTKKLVELEGKQFSIFSLSSSIFREKTSDKGFLLKKRDTPDKSQKNDFKIRLETRKETNPFLLEPPKHDEQDEDFIEKVKKKGVFLKIDVPIKK